MATPTRAIIEVSAAEFKLVMRNRRTGEVQELSWPRSSLAEVRMNRFENGLWLDVPGKFKGTVLKDLPRETLELLECALKKALDGQADAIVDQ